MKHFLFLLICSIFIFSSCDGNNSEPQLSALNSKVKNDSLPSRRQLRRNFFEKQELLIVYGAQDENIEKNYKILLEEISKTPQIGRRTTAINYKSIEEITQSDIQNRVLFLLGTPESNSLIKELSVDLPLSFSSTKLIFNQNDYSNKKDIISLMFYPNPKNINLPFSFITGNSEHEVFNFIKNKLTQNSRRRGFFFQNMDYEIFSNDTKVQMGNFDTTWKIDPKVYFDYSTGNDTILKSEYYNFISHQEAISTLGISQLNNDIETSTKAILTFLGKKNISSKINYHIYKTAEDKGLMLGNTEQAHFDINDHSVHTIINDKYANNFIQKENDLIIQHLLGSSKSLTLGRGLPVFFTSKWQREGYEYWVGRLAKSGNTLSLEELFDNELIENESDLVVDCMSAALIDFLIKKLGKDQLLNRYQNWTPSPKEISNLESSWQQYLDIIARNTKVVAKRNFSTTYLKGFNFAHEGYGIYNGYLSRKATDALVKQKEMGANAITIVPYSYIRGSGNIEPTYLSLNKGAGSENDQGVIHSAYEAKKMGMSTLLKPQIFVGGSWPGEMDFETEEQWQAFFSYYYRWIRHYAFLAEIHNIEMLSVGVEFSIATLTHESNWTRMIKNIRGFYSGKLTYSANWGKEFETISLWKDLDFIGINSYYPLSNKNDATDEELKTSFNKVKSKIKSVYNTYKKPIVFTEIGFRSINAPWKQPYSDGDNTIFNEEHQDRAYKVIFEGIENEEWCGGILWWKFPSYLEYRGVENTAFTPNNKRAETTVRKWFAK
ncbi:hypothetical protein D7030_03695 [Flavobacteriaceae bacterium AU392]|nr:hypothetical protein D1817_10170 [Flavobacteriaceae bacterium]RKM85780.1 hypothetical protein D7030_03695 [Flavobacteriaceae bacterium AU392]